MYYRLYLALAGCITAGAAVPAEEPVISQAEAQKLSAKVSEIGSDKSLQASTVLAMQALIKFSDSDIPGAIAGAYGAYGKFKTSENLDRARRQSLLAKASLGSAELSNLTASEIAFLGSSTSFRRLDTVFLSIGDDSKISGEFERKTGIKGKDFVNMLAAAAENKLYVSDPKLAEKIDAEAGSFIEKIPNTEFRAKVKSAMSLVPSLTRHQLLVKSVQKIVQLVGPVQATKTPELLALQPLGPAKEEVARVPSVSEEASDAEEAIEPTPELAIATALHADQIAKVHDGENLGDQKLDSIFRAAVESESETLFLRVSRKYRSVASKLSQL